MKHYVSGKFYRYILKNLIFILFLLSILFVTFYYYREYKHNKKASIQAMEYEARRMSSGMDDKLLSSSQILNSLSINPTVISFLKQNHYDPGLALSTYRQFTSIAGLLPSLQLNAGTYNQSLDLILSSEGSYDMNYFLKKYPVESQEQVERFLKGDSKTGSIFTVSGVDDRYFMFLSEKSLFMESSPFFLVVEKDSLANGLSPIQPLSLSIRASVDVVESEYDFTCVSKVWPITYCYRFDDQPTLMSLTFIIMNILMIALLLFFNVLLTYHVSKRLYQPVKNLVFSSSEDSEDVVDDEFAHIQKKLDYLKTVIQINNLSKEDIVLKEIIYGIKKNHYQQLLEQNHLEYLTGRFYGVIIMAKNPMEESGYISQIYIEAMLSPGISALETKPSIKIVDISPATHVILAGGISRETLKALLTPIALQTTSHHFLLMEETDISTISRRFFLLNGYLKYISHEHKGLLLEEQIDSQASQPFSFTEEDKKFLLYYLNAKNEQEYKRYVENLIQENLVQRTLSKQTKQSFLSAVVEFLVPLAPDLNDAGDLCTALAHMDDREQLCISLIDIFEDYYTAADGMDTQGNLKNRFLAYIHEHYDTDISLSDMAEEFNLAGNYVSVLFKEKTGYNFKQFLNTYRIDVAKQILMEKPDTKIKDLAASVGFANINTFIRIFKAQEGIPPGQYQKYVLDNLRNSML